MKTTFASSILLLFLSTSLFLPTLAMTGEQLQELMQREFIDQIERGFVMLPEDTPEERDDDDEDDW